MVTNPNTEWYAAISMKNGTPPRCPFATVEHCPRNYQSVSLLGRVGANTPIDARTDKRLLRKWQKTQLWPKVREQETAIAGPPGDPRIYSHFCPEVIYDNFGYFADYLSEFPDEIDREQAARRLQTQGAIKDDWRWHFSSLNPIHFTECHLYSLLQTSKPKNEDIIEIKPNFHGIGINLNALYRRLFTRKK